MITLNILNSKAKKYEEEYKKLAIEDIESLVESLQDFQEEYLETWVDENYCGESFTEENLEEYQEYTIDLYISEVVFRNTYEYFNDYTINYIKKQINCNSDKFNNEEIIKMYLKEYKHVLLV